MDPWTTLRCPYRRRCLLRRACGGRGGSASAALGRHRADAPPAPGARSSQGVHAAAVQLADGHVLGAQRSRDIHRTGRVHARHARTVRAAAASRTFSSRSPVTVIIITTNIFGRNFRGADATELSRFVASVGVNRILDDSVLSQTEYLKTAARHPQLSIDICCRRRRSAANPPAAVAADERRDRQTDARPLHRPVPHTK